MNWGGINGVLQESKGLGMKSCRNQKQGSKILHLAKFRGGCENLQPLRNFTFNPLKTASRRLTTLAKQNITIMNKSTKIKIKIKKTHLKPLGRIVSLLFSVCPVLATRVHVPMG